MTGIHQVIQAACLSPAAAPDKSCRGVAPPNQIQRRHISRAEQGLFNSIQIMCSIYLFLQNFLVANKIVQQKIGTRQNIIGAIGRVDVVLLHRGNRKWSPSLLFVMCQHQKQSWFVSIRKANVSLFDLVSLPVCRQLVVLYIGRTRRKLIRRFVSLHFHYSFTLINSSSSVEFGWRSFHCSQTHGGHRHVVT